MAELLPGVPLDCYRLQFSDQDGTFPFPFIPKYFAFPEIIQDAKALTSSASLPMTAPAIQTLVDKEKHIKDFHLSEDLFRNLIAYADSSRKLPNTDFAYSTLGLVPNGRCEASGEALAKAVFAMHAQIEVLKLRTPCPANSEIDVQILVVSPMFSIANLAIQQRYRLDGPDGQPLRHVDVPHWRTEDIDDSPAGIPDGILHGGTDKKPNAVFQCKLSWEYTNAMLQGIFVDGVLRGEDGNYDWDRLDTLAGEARLIRELWDSMVEMSCSFAVWSNGSKAFFAVRFPDQWRLVCTPPVDWSHHNTVRAVIGLTYAALDENDWRNINLTEKLVGATTPV
ncbi:hypothetical protein CPC08DRAFT_769147 [Agrocybe pediades]|nr:hypothetical protein CPC08DRAFT_769147 [Agrocybe pediades]